MILKINIKALFVMEKCFLSIGAKLRFLKFFKDVYLDLKLLQRVKGEQKYKCNVTRLIPGSTYTASYIQRVCNASSLWVKDKFHTLLRSILGLKCIGFTPTLLCGMWLCRWAKFARVVITSFLSFVTESYKLYLYGNTIFRKAFRNEIVL
jgi:hypothetical protein